MDFYKKYRKPYSGRVLDGPFEGDVIEHDSPYFMGQFQRPTLTPQYGLMAPSTIEIDRVYYRWLSSYRAWVWMQVP